MKFMKTLWTTPPARLLITGLVLLPSAPVWAQDVDAAPAPSNGWVTLVGVIVLCLLVFALSVKNTKRYHQVI